MEDFDDIRPYTDSEIPAAMYRIAHSDAFPLIASWIYPGRNLEDVRQLVCSFKTIREFQLEVMVKVNQRVIDRTMTDFTFSGLDNIRSDRSYLYVSNHRDIMLDASLLEYVLASQLHLDTTEITFGANLMTPGLVTDIGKSNKMFRVERAGLGNIRDFYVKSQHLSNYIRHTLVDNHHSVWIAQRNGRTKDGNDRTDQGIIKMFGMSMPDDKIRAISDLHILPVSISYEWESCDILKALELYESRKERYIKKPGEDLTSILTGITQPKGHVHISFCPEITTPELHQFDACTSNEYHKQVARLIDSRILSAYHLSPNNYIAHDLRYGQSHFASYYTAQQKQLFLDYMSQLNSYELEDPDVLKDIFLGIYSNPIDSKKL